MDRRDLLKLGLGAAVAAAWWPPALAQLTPALQGKLATLAKGLRGQVILPGDGAYALASQVYNGHFQAVLPLAVVRVADATDVAAAVAFAREEQLEFVVRSGRHSFAGVSATRGLVIDVSALTAVEVDLAKGTAKVGAGQTNLPLYEALWPHKMAVPGGTCPTVGISGLTLGAGFGRLSPLAGLACDNLLAATVVTADGRIVVADAEQNSDLFWALRGGGGSFGAVTDLTFRLTPVDGLFTEVKYVFPWTGAAAVLRAWQQWIGELPREGHSELLLITGAPEYGSHVEVDFTLAGPRDKAEALARMLVAEAGVDPASYTSITAPFLSTQRNWGCAALRADECQYVGLTADAKLARTASCLGSDYVFEPWPDEGFAPILEAFARRQRDPQFTPAKFNADAQVGKIILESTGGAIDDTAPDAMAFPHRKMLYMAQYQARWLPGADETVAEANLAWLRQMYEAVAPWRSGASYSNYTDLGLVDWQNAYYGANLPRLKDLKRTYDPDNVFRFPQSIPPA